MTICNACRYCEGYCAVFPAMEKRLTFSDGRHELSGESLPQLRRSAITPANTRRRTNSRSMSRKFWRKSGWNRTGNMRGRDGSARRLC